MAGHGVSGQTSAELLAQLKHEQESQLNKEVKSDLHWDIENQSGQPSSEMRVPQARKPARAHPAANPAGTWRSVSREARADFPTTDPDDPRATAVPASAGRRGRAGESAHTGGRDGSRNNAAGSSGDGGGEGGEGGKRAHRRAVIGGWTYSRTGQEGPWGWGNQFPLCASGKAQSPVDIVADGIKVPHTSPAKERSVLLESPTDRKRVLSQSDSEGKSANEGESAGRGYLQHRAALVDPPGRGPGRLAHRRRPASAGAITRPCKERCPEQMRPEQMRPASAPDREQMRPASAPDREQMRPASAPDPEQMRPASAPDPEQKSHDMGKGALRKKPTKSITRSRTPARRTSRSSCRSRPTGTKAQHGTRRVQP